MPVPSPAPSTRTRARHVRGVLACALALVIAAAATSSISTAASDSTVVTVDVPSAITVVNGCSAPSATEFGAVLPGSRAVTATGPGRCTVSWESSNDTAMLRIAQRDGTGTAMSRPASFTGSTNWARFNAVSSLDGTDVLVVGDTGRFSYSGDGGATWTHVAPIGGIGGEVTDVAQVPSDATTAWIVGSGQRLQRVTSATTVPDATSLFAQLQASGWPAAQSPTAVLVLDEDTIIVGGTAGWMARSDTDGASWTSYRLPGSTGSTSVNALSLAPTGHVWAGTHSAPGGNLWRTPTTAAAAPGDWTQFPTAIGSSGVRAVRVTGASNGYAVGPNGSTYSFNGTTWTWRGNYDLESRRLTALTSPPGSPSIANAYGEDGSIIRTTDGGTTWSRVASPTGSQLRAATGGIGWTIAVGLGQAVIASADDGASFAFVRDEPSARERRGVALDPAHGRVALAVGSRGSIWRSTDGGGTWSLQPPPTTSALFDVTFATRTIAWAAGADGTLLRSGDGGLTWSDVPTGTASRLLSVSAPAAHAVIAVGEGGTVVRSTNGGASVDVGSAGPPVSLRSVSMADESVGLAGGGLRVLRTTDGGETWNPASSLPASVVVRGVSMPSPTTGYAAAQGGVWRSTDGGSSFVASTSLDSFSANAVHAVTDRVLHAVDTKLATSTDGGATWQITNLPGEISLSSIAASDANHVVLGAVGGAAYRREASTDPGVAVPDYGAAPNAWAASGEAMFGVCVQAIGAQTSISAPWVVDDGTCTASDADPWRAVPDSPTPIATVPVAGNTGSIDLVWGVRFPDQQAPGTYTAGIAFEAVAPAV